MPDQEVSIRCSRCGVRHHCLADHLEGDDRAWLENSLERVGPVAPGERLFRAGEPLQHMAAVFSGIFKSTRRDKGGREGVAAFHVPGDLLGVEGLFDARHRWDVVAVDTSYACLFDYQRIQDIAQQVPGIRRQMMRLLSRQLREMDQLAGGTAERRLAVFLREWGVRLALRGNSRNHFVLQMSRREMANHLNLTPESVSRAFRRLADQGIIRVEQDEVRVLDEARLAAV